MQASSPRNDFVYHISVSDDGNKDSAGGAGFETSRKRKLREDYQMKVTMVWNVMRTCYCSEDRTRPIVDLDFRTATFHDLEYRIFTIIDDDDIGIVDNMITLIGRLVYEGVPFEKVDEMVNRIRGVVDKAFRSGRPRERLDVMVTVKNQTGLPLEEYEAVLRPYS